MTRPLESLEGRQMFTVAVAHILPDTVVCTGDAADDQVYVYDNGRGFVSGYATNAAGGLTAFGGWAGVRRVIVNTAGGDDEVNYRMYGDNLAGGATFVQVDLGDGNDTLKVDLTGDIDMGPNAYFDLKARGGKGKDTMVAYYRGEHDGRMSLQMDGGDDADSLVTDVRFDPGSTGGLFARSYGGLGDDTIDMLVRKVNPLDPVFVDAGVSGQGDVDTVHRTPLAWNDATCEFVFVVP
jgi:hypothetical protein